MQSSMWKKIIKKMFVVRNRKTQSIFKKPRVTMQKFGIVFNLVYYWSELDRPDFLGESDTLIHGMCGEATQKRFLDL